MIYNEESPPTSGPEFLHFSQVIWKSSSTVGCATVQCGAGTIFSYGSWYTGERNSFQYNENKANEIEI
jgi:hypothetical protein